MTHDTQSRSLCLTHGAPEEAGARLWPAVWPQYRDSQPLPQWRLPGQYNVLHLPKKLPSLTKQAPLVLNPGHRVSTKSGICFVDRTMDSGQITRMHNGNNQWRILTMFVANIEWQKHSDKDQNTTRKCGKGLAFHPSKYIGNPRR